MNCEIQIVTDSTNYYIYVAYLDCSKIIHRDLINRYETSKKHKRKKVNDEWIDIFRFKLFNFNDETYYVRYLVIDSIQCKITISCFIENTATVFIQNCENGKSYEERIEFQPFCRYEDKHRVQILCDSFIKGFKYLNVDLKCAENYFDFIMFYNG